MGWWILAPIRCLRSTENEESCTPIEQRMASEYRRCSGAGAREMVRHAFQDLGLAEVIGETMAFNAG